MKKYKKPTIIKMAFVGTCAKCDNGSCQGK